MASEWVKLRSVRATRWTALGTVVVIVGYGAFIAANFSSGWHTLTASQRATFDPTEVVLEGFVFAQILIGGLGVLVAGSEYGSGSVRSSLLAVPRRGVFLAGKVLMLTLVCTVLSLTATAGAFALGQRALHGGPPSAAWSDPGVARAVLGCAVYLVLVALMGAAFGFMTRSTAAALSAVFGVLLILPILVRGLAQGLRSAIEPYLPSSIGGVVTSAAHPDPDLLAPVTGLCLLGAYCAALIAVAYWLLRQRDA